MGSERYEPQILPLDETHLPDVAGLERLCFYEPWSENSLRLLTQEGALGRVVVTEDRLVAYGGMTVVLDEGAVTNIAVHPDVRRRGFGRLVTEALLAAAVERGVRTVFLEVRESNAAAISLYEALGFRACGIRKGFYRHPVESAIQMVWTKEEVTEEGRST